MNGLALGNKNDRAEQDQLRDQGTSHRPAVGLLQFGQARCALRVKFIFKRKNLHGILARAEQFGSLAKFGRRRIEILLVHAEQGFVIQLQASFDQRAE